MIKKALFGFVSLLVLIGGVLALYGVHRWNSSEALRSLPAPVQVEIEPGTSGQQALRLLAEKGVIADPLLLRIRMKLGRPAGTIQAGEYRFEDQISDASVLQDLIDGKVILYSITIPEGLVLEQIAERYEAEGLATRAEILNAASNTSLINDLDPQADTLEGYLFPDTYQFPKGTSAEAMVAAMVDRFRSVVGEDYSNRAEALGLSMREAVTLASMIERETGVSAERERVSRVFHNRIALGMKMQCDPTVRYAWRRKGVILDRLLYKHLDLDSPWNTYYIAGLPKGPIANPGKASLFAAIEPEEGDELYFVAAPEGGHTFSRTLAEHERAVAVWRRYVRSSM